MSEDRRMLGVGIVGTNWGAIAHLPVWQSLPGVEVRAICTSRKETAEQAQRKFSLPLRFWNFTEMAEAPEIDIFVCGTRPPLRYEMAKAALSAGKHVYNNIPFTPTLPQARELLALQRSRGRVGAVDAFIQSVPALAYLKELVAENALGRVSHVHVAWNLPIWNNPEPAMGLEWFADHRNGASALRNMGAHILHSLVHVFGPIEDVCGRSEQFVGEWRYADGRVLRPQVDDTAVAIVRLRSGVLVSLNVGWTAADGQGFVLEAHGDRGRAKVLAPGMPQSFSTRLFGSLAGDTARPMGEERELPMPQRFKVIPGTSLNADDATGPFFANAVVATDLIRAVRTTGDAAPSFEQAVHVQEAVEAIVLSGKLGRWIRLCDVDAILQGQASI